MGSALLTPSSRVDGNLISTQVNTFKLLDADGSGELDFVEFCATFYLYCTFTWAGLVKYAFDITDVDRSGLLGHGGSRVVVSKRLRLHGQTER